MKTPVFTNGEIDVSKISSAVDYTVPTAEKERLFYNAEFTAASKSLVLGLADGSCCFVCNVGGTNAFTVKNISTDTGTSVGAGKVALVIASETANTTKCIVLN